MSNKILVVDDELATCKIVQRILKNGGMESDTAQGGDTAIALLNKSAYDVVVLDLHMPGTDGFAVLDWLKEHRPTIVSLVLSGTQDLNDVIQAMHHGAFDFYTKPVRPGSIFVEFVRRALKHKKLQDSHENLVNEIQEKNLEMELRLGQLAMAHKVLQTQTHAIQADLHRAQSIQQGLLPRMLPFHDRVSAAAFYLPANQVGGDLFDVFRLDDTHLGFLVADTAGHGVSSALVTVFLKNVLQPWDDSEGCKNIVPPGEVLQHMNEMTFATPFGKDLFVSMLYAVLNVETLVLEYANAGHPPLLQRKADGAILHLREPAPAIGLNPNVKYATRSHPLEEDDMLLMYTDGVTDVQNKAGQFFCRDRMEQVVVDQGADPLPMLQHLEQALQEYCEGQAYPDDVTALAISMKPQDNPALPIIPDVSLQADEEIHTAGALRVARENGIRYVSISGAGTWQEGRYLLELRDRAIRDGDEMLLFDFEYCEHLDSTFMGVLHTICREADEQENLQVRVQQIPRALLKLMSELGLATVLMHFHSRVKTLPQDMLTEKPVAPSQEVMGELLMKAHKALVEADPGNAERFAGVLNVLQQKTKIRKADSE